MRIITWNVNGIRAVAKKGFFDFMSKTDADVFCVQESKAHPDQAEPELLNPFGRESHWSPAQRPGYSGTVTYTKVAPKSVRKGIGIKKFDSEGRFMITDHGDFLLYNSYFPNGGSGQERHDFKQEFLLRINEHMKAQLAAGREVILVGDYNVAHKNEDVYDPKKLAGESGFLPEERQWFDRFLDVGFVDLFRKFHPDTKHRFTWWNYLDKGRLGNRGWRIDYICASKGIAARAKSCEILDDIQGSDHCPVICELDLS